MSGSNLLSGAAPPVDPMDFSGRYNTQLSQDEETRYQQWVADQSARQGRDMSQDLYDYDLRGAWKAGADAAAGGHYPDTYKKPNHPTFSTGSQYHGMDGYLGGAWGGGQGGNPYTFTPSETNLQMMPLSALRRYFASPAEAGRSVLIEP